MWLLWGKIYFIRNGFWKIYEVKPERGDFNWHWFILLRCILWCYSSICHQLLTSIQICFGHMYCECSVMGNFNCWSLKKAVNYSTGNWLPYTRHYNPLLFKNREKFLVIQSSLQPYFPHFSILFESTIHTTGSYDINITLLESQHP